MTAPERKSGPRLFSIPPGVPFLPTLAEALCTGRLIDGFAYDPSDPLRLADATIYVPTRRAARVLRSDFVDQLGGKSAILPVIRPLGETDDDSGYFDADAAALDLLPPVAQTEALVELAGLILRWKEALPHSVSGFHQGGPLVAPASPADALWLARGLADLLDAMETHQCPWSRFSRIEAADHAEWWQLTLEFLKIASQFWPARLGELNRSSPAAHRNAVLAAETERLARSTARGPTIVAGSTGSVPATAALMKAISRLDEGALVLPGLDFHIGDAVWPMVSELGRSPESRVEPATLTHPQYGLSLLLDRLGASRADVIPLGAEPSTIRARNGIVSRALLPARATSLWAEQPVEPTIQGAGSGEAFEGVSLIEAANEREEATAIAVAMRVAGEDPQARVALVTPDRNLARRVARELRRFGIEANDSGGEPLASSSPATFVTLLLDAVMQPGDPVALTALLNHPLARFGFDAETMRRAASALERLALRGAIGSVDVASLVPLVERAWEQAAADRHAPEWRKRLSEDDRALARDLALRLERIVEPLAGRFLRFRAVEGPEPDALSDRHDLASWARDTIAVVEAATADPQSGLASLWGSEAGERLVALFTDLIATRSQLLTTGAEWADITQALMAGEMIKPDVTAHPRMFIWGTLEARLQTVDTVVLGGLNEGSWPGQTSNDPFLSRAMKVEIGLEPPERRIGLAAHDFQMAMGAQAVVLSRASRADKAPTIASRWLQRLLVVVGEEAGEAMRRRGAAYLAKARKLDESEPRPLAERPAPKPPAESQPIRYSFSEVKTLRRDPYAIYARKVLRLDPLSPLIRDPGVAERGTLYHAILEAFTASMIDPGDPDAGVRLAEIADRLFVEAELPAHIAVLWRPRFAEIGRLFLKWERERQADIVQRNTERRGQTVLPATGVLLTGLADRIDIRGDGTAEIIDYKTGSEPSRKQARALLDPQLALEAWTLEAGGFAGLGRVEPSSLQYVRLRTGEKLVVDALEGYDKANTKNDDGTYRSPRDLGQDAVRELERFVAVLRSRERGFASRLIPASARDYGNDYDHLARVAEWASADADADGEADAR